MSTTRGAVSGRPVARTRRRSGAHRCPACGTRLGLLGYEWEVTLAFRHPTDDGWGEPELEIGWRFDPCGCEGREILSG